MIYKQNGVKMMRPVLTREEYLSLRNGGFQKENVARIRQGDGALKTSLVQMNYSCLPNEDGTLKGSKRMSTTVGMDIDFVAPKELSPEGTVAGGEAGVAQRAYGAGARAGAEQEGRTGLADARAERDKGLPPGVPPSPRAQSGGEPEVGLRVAGREV